MRLLAFAFCLIYLFFNKANVAAEEFSDLSNSSEATNQTDSTKWLFEEDIAGLGSNAINSVDVLKTISININGAVDGNFLWTNHVVPYVLSHVYDANSREIILQAIKGFNATCLRFVPRTIEEDYLLITPGISCFSNVGRIGGRQTVSIRIPECVSHGIIQHQLMHALGFFHEQSRIDRDNFVDIYFENIISDKQNNFMKYTNVNGVNSLPYDFGSVMHFGEFEFARSPKAMTIQPKYPYEDVKIGQRMGLSEIDVKKINALYNCPSTNVPSLTPTDSSKTKNSEKIEPVEKNLPPESFVSSIDPVFETPHRGCYYPDWAQWRTGVAKYTAENVDPSLCTYIIVAFGNIVGNTVELFEPNDADTFLKFNNYKIQYPNLKLFLSVGGRTRRDQLNKMAKTSDGRSAFIASVVSNLRIWGLDGFDIDWDWELTPTPSEKILLPILLAEFRSAFELESAQTRKQRIALSTALHWAPQVQGINGSMLEEALDIANVQAYDQGNTVWDSSSVSHHSPLFKGPLGISSPSNMASIIGEWALSGISKSKLVAGLPLYGRGWLLKSPIEHGFGAAATGVVPPSNYTQQPGVWPFYEICQRIASDRAINVFDSTTMASYAYTSTWWMGFNDVRTVKTKAEWVKENGFGGVYVWDLSQDDFQDMCGFGKNPLLTAIRDELRINPEKMVSMTAASSSASNLRSRSLYTSSFYLPVFVIFLWLSVTFLAAGSMFGC